MEKPSFKKIHISVAFEPQPTRFLFLPTAPLYENYSSSSVLVSVIARKGLPLPHGPRLWLHFQLKSKLPTFLISFSPVLQSFISGKSS